MLKVGVHHGHVAGLAGQHSFDAGAGEAAPADSADAADPVVVFANFARDRRGSVRRIIVDENNFPFAASEHGAQPFDDLRNIVAFFECRDDDSEFRSGPCNHIGRASLGNLWNNGRVLAHSLFG